MANNEVKITLKAIDEATHTIVRFSAESAKSLNNLNTTLKDMQRQSALAFRATQQHIDDTEKKIRGSSPGILSGLGSWIVGFVSITAAINALEKGAALEGVMKSFEVLSKQAGISANVLKKDLMEATAGVVNQFTAISKANLALAGGLSKNQIVEFMQLSRKVAVATGRDVADSYQRLVEATTKLEPELLDELGVVIRLNDINKQLAKTHGVNAKELDKSTQIAGFAAEALKQLHNKYGAIIVDSHSLHSSLGRIKTGFTDTVAVSGQLLGSIVRLGLIGFDGLKEAINGATMSAQEHQNALINLAEQAIITISDLQNVFKALQGLQGENLALARMFQKGFKFEVGGDLNKALKMSEIFQLIFTRFDNTSATLEKQFARARKEIQKFTGEGLGIDQIKAMYEAYKKFSELPAPKATKAGAAGVAGVDKKAEAEREKFANWLANLKQQATDDPFKRLAEGVGELSLKLSGFKYITEQERDMAKGFIEEWRKLEEIEIIKNLLEPLREVDKAIKKAAESLRKDLIEAAKEGARAFDEMMKPSIDEVTEAYMQLRDIQYLNREELNELANTFMRMGIEGKANLLELNVALGLIGEKLADPSLSEGIETAWDKAKNLRNTFKDLRDDLANITIKDFITELDQAVPKLAAMAKGAADIMIGVAANTDFMSVTGKGIERRTDEILEEAKKEGESLSREEARSQAKEEAGEEKGQFGEEASKAIGGAMGDALVPFLGPAAPLFGMGFGELLSQNEGLQEALGAMLGAIGDIFEALRPFIDLVAWNLKIIAKGIEWVAKIITSMVDILKAILNALNPMNWFEKLFGGKSEAEIAKETGKPVHHAARPEMGPGHPAQREYWIMPDGSIVYRDPSKSSSESIIPAFGSGGPVWADMPAFLHKNEHVITASQVVALGGHKSVERIIEKGGASTANISINIAGNADSQTIQELVDKLERMFAMGQFRPGRGM